METDERIAEALEGIRDALVCLVDLEMKRAIARGEIAKRDPADTPTEETP